MDFKFCKRELDDSGNLVIKPLVITSASRKDHSDLHYLYKVRKALVLLVGEENMKGYTANQIEELHAAVVRSLVDSGITHWYETYDSDLDDSLPEDLKLKSDGYEPDMESSLFDLDEDEIEYLKLLEENGVRMLWTAPTKRKNVPSSHFLDPKNKKYPYKNADGTVSCGGLKSAIQAAGGARSGKKNAKVQAKAKSLYKKHCQEKEAETFPIVGKMI